MSQRNRPSLADRIATAAEAALAAEHSVAPVEVLAGIGWLDPGAFRRWRQGQLDFLEPAMQVDPSRIAEALSLLRSWASAKGLIASETDYVARAPQRQKLRFSGSGNEDLERVYRTHWVSPDLSEDRRAHLVQKASRAPDLVVIQPLKDDWTCHRCGGKGDLLIMENGGPSCLKCAGLDDLVFLGSGDATLTRRAKAKSDRCAVVVRWSRARKRYERRGLLVEPQALAAAERQVP
jgi:hypothetical protein